MFGRKTSSVILFFAITLTLLLSACGGGNRAASPAADPSDGTEAAASSPRGRSAVPTMPAAQFGAPTAVIDLTRVAETDAEPDTAGPDLALGESAYARLCAECHGTGGEGVADQGAAVLGLDLDAGALEDLLRTGGGFGNEHIFGPSKISEDGIAALAAYMATLSQ